MDLALAKDVLTITGAAVAIALGVLRVYEFAVARKEKRQEREDQTPRAHLQLMTSVSDSLAMLRVRVTNTGHVPLNACTMKLEGTLPTSPQTAGMRITGKMVVLPLLHHSGPMPLDPYMEATFELREPFGHELARWYRQGVPCRLVLRAGAREIVEASDESLRSVAAHLAHRLLPVEVPTDANPVIEQLVQSPREQHRHSAP